MDNISILKLVKTKTNSNYLIRYLDKAIRTLALIMPKISKLMFLRIDYGELLFKIC